MSWSNSSSSNSTPIRYTSNPNPNSGGRGGKKKGGAAKKSYAFHQSTTAATPQTKTLDSWISSSDHSTASSPASSSVSSTSTSSSSSAGKSTVYAIGYGGASSQSFVRQLQSNQIDVLVDIRISPYSGFNRDYCGDKLKTILESAHPPIKYLHLIELGNMFKSSDENDPVLGANPYIDLLNIAGELLTRRLRSLIETGSIPLLYEAKRSTESPPLRVCIMCACKDHNSCHRNAVSGCLKAQFSYEVVHIPTPSG
eukprot:TRINITY_DN149_c0_g1_i1.p1 TRINITY_DN149_c0_g1~~TRINITY_DN149_c0_g1_i1.p1  ORF type:complete len:254 (+),score=38.96 TRINITY_DN149_c0_g1_i1:257-1018(+)